MDFSQLRVKPLRFIPFDLGVNLSPKERKEIHLYLKNKYLVKELDERKKAILSREPIIASIYGKDDKLELYLFDTGIGVFVLKDKIMMYKEDIRFAAKFLKDRKDCHHSILEGKYSESLAIHKVINEIRSVLSLSNKKMRVSGLPSWEYDGLSYVMSIYFFYPIKQIKQTISFTDLPLIQTSELLIFLVAYLQIAPDLYDYFANPAPLSVPALIKTIGLFVVIACIIIIRNRYR